MNKPWKMHIGTIFPDLFPGTLGVSCINRKRNDDWDMKVYDLRSYSANGRIDDTPFGGGGGMIIRCDVIHKWIKDEKLEEVRKFYLSPRGRVFNQSMVDELTGQDIVMLCGRYEGVDQRVLEYWGFEEVSLGDFILHGGEVAAMAILEACLRKFAVKNYHLVDSFSNILLEHNQYTRPREWFPEPERPYTVPAVLVSGNHSEVELWKKSNSISNTAEKRPDLLEKYQKMCETGDSDFLYERNEHDNNNV